MVLSPNYFQQKHIYTDRGQRVEQKTDTFDNQNGNGGNIKLLYVHEDIMGNTRYHTKDNGQSYAELEYDVWGKPTSPNMLLNNDNGVFIFAQFTGHIYDTVLDIYFAEARFYDAKGRQWLNSDPMKDGLNWYLYVGANPATFFDPSGLKFELIDPKVDDYKSKKAYDKAKAVYDAQKAEYDIAIEYLNQSDDFRNLYKELEDSEKTIKIVFTTDKKQSFSFKEGTIYWNPKVGILAKRQNEEDKKRYIISPAVLFAHEMYHAKQYNDVNDIFWLDDPVKLQNKAIYFENLVICDLGEKEARQPSDAYGYYEGGYYYLDTPTDWGYDKFISYENLSKWKPSEKK